MIRNIAHWITNSPHLVLGGLLILTISLGSGLSKLETDNNHDSELPESDILVQTKEYLEEIFGDKDILLVGFETEDMYSEASLQKIAAISEDLKTVEGVIENEITSLYTLNNIRANEWGLDVSPLFKTANISTEERTQLRANILENELFAGRVISKNEDFTVISANLEEEYQQQVIYDSVIKITEKYKGDNDHFYLAGDPIQQQEIDIGIQGDIRMMMPAALLLIIFGYFLCFRSFQGVYLPLSVVILSIVWTMGAMGHLGFHINVVTSSIPLLMIAVSSSYGIHMFQRYKDELEHGNLEHGNNVVYQATYKIMPAILMTGITSALGAATLLVFKVESIKQFGIVTSLGLISVTILTLSLIPALLALRRKNKIIQQNTRTFFDRFLIQLANFSIQNNRLILASTVLIIVISIYGASKVRVGNDFIKYFPEDHRLTIVFNKFIDKLGGASYMDVMIDGGEEDAIKDPVLLSKIWDFQQFIEQQEGVGYSHSFANIMKRINEQMNKDQLNLASIPNSQEAIAQYLLLYSMSGDPSDFSDLVDYNYQRAKVRVMLTSTEQDLHQDLYDNLHQYAQVHFEDQARIDFGGDVMFWLAQVRYIVEGKIQNIILAIVIVALFCMLVFRSLYGGLICIIPLAVSTLFTFGIMGFLGWRLETSTALITAIGVGIGVDFAIHYITRFREELGKGTTMEIANQQTMLSSGKAIIYDVFSTILGFIVFLTSGFIPLQYFGVLITLTMISVAVASLIVFPAFFVTFQPTFLYQKISKKKAIMSKDKWKKITI